MGPIALYKFEELNKKKIDNRLKWIDEHKNSKLRTNHSDDDLVCKSQPLPITSHKQVEPLRPIMKRSNQNNKGALNFNFYNPEDKLGNEGLEIDNTEEPAIEEIPKTNTLSGNINYDPMIGNKQFGNTMPLPKK